MSVGLLHAPLPVANNSSGEAIEIIESERKRKVDDDDNDT